MRHRTRGFTSGIVRRSTSGVLTHVAGKFQGATGEGIAATATLYPAPPRLAISGSDGTHRVRSINVSTNLVSTITGDGAAAYSGDDVPASTAPNFVSPMPAGHLAITDTGNPCVRIIW